MEVTEMRVDVSLTMNLGNYESAKILAGVSASINPQDNQVDCFSNLWDMCEAEVKKQAKGIQSDMAERLREKKKPG